MDVAGPLALTAIFPGVIGFVMVLVALLYFADSDSPMRMEERVFFRRVMIPGSLSLGVAIIMWIVAIWIGAAQLAGAH